jgi:hypothetical protein
VLVDPAVLFTKSQLVAGIHASHKVPDPAGLQALHQLMAQGYRIAMVIGSKHDENWWVENNKAKFPGDILIYNEKAIMENSAMVAGCSKMGDEHPDKPEWAKRVEQTAYLTNTYGGSNKKLPEGLLPVSVLSWEDLAAEIESKFSSASDKTPKAGRTPGSSSGSTGKNLLALIGALGVAQMIAQVVGKGASLLPAAKAAVIGAGSSMAPAQDGFHVWGIYAAAAILLWTMYAWFQRNKAESVLVRAEAVRDWSVLQALGNLPSRLGELQSEHSPSKLLNTFCEGDPGERRTVAQVAPALMNEGA